MKNTITVTRFFYDKSAAVGLYRAYAQSRLTLRIDTLDHETPFLVCDLGAVRGFLSGSIPAEVAVLVVFLMLGRAAVLP